MTQTYLSIVSKIQNLMLARLLVCSKPQTRSKLGNDVKKFFEARMSDAEWRTQFDETLAQAVGAGLITDSPFQLTAQGRQAALEFLGVDELPRLQWKALQNRYIVPRLLGLDIRSASVRERVSKAEFLRAAVITKEHELPTSPAPTIRQAMDAIAWQQLGRKTDKPFTRSAVVSYLLSEKLGLDRPLEEEKLKARLAATAMGARNTSAQQLRDAIIQRWVEEEIEAPVHKPTLEPESTELDLREFAGQVLTVARRCSTGRFEEKVFISHVWRQFHNEPFGSHVNEDEFKTMLVNAQRENLISLSRADLVQAFDPKDVRESEIRSEYYTFHFINVPQEMS